jgi:D-amino-acid dehydrogenase
MIVTNGRDRQNGISQRPAIEAKSASMSHVVIIGGGLVGASVAYHLLRHGAQVTVVDRSDAGQATAAGAGILPPLDHFVDDLAMLPLIKAARAHYPALLDALQEDDEHETGYDVVGALHVAFDAVEAERLSGIAAECEARRREGYCHIGAVAIVDGAGARELFPALSREVVGAVHAPGAARLDARRLLGALRSAILKRGGRWLHTSAELVLAGDRVVGVRGEGGMIEAESVVIAGGAWSQRVAAALGLSLGVVPQRGQLLHLSAVGQDTARWPIVLGSGWNYLLAFPEGRIVAGATREDGVGYDGRVTAAGVQGVLERALRLAPALAEATLTEVRVGFRPLSQDGKPVLGPAPDHPNVFFATGHGGFGLEVGPYSGALVADLVLGHSIELDLEPFSAGRFSSHPQPRA